MKILAIGAHHDDIEINCAGTLLKHKDKGAELYLVVCIKGSSVASYEDMEEEQLKVDKKIGYKKTWYLRGQDSYLTQNPTLILELDNIVAEVKPDFVYTHSDNDYHQDHVAVAKTVRAVNRRSLFSLFSFPAENRSLPFYTNCFVDITNYFKQKMEILKFYKTQSKRYYFNKDIIIARNLGTESEKYVERFHIEILKL